jgi:hypothetical protein
LETTYLWSSFAFWGMRQMNIWVRLVNQNSSSLVTVFCSKMNMWSKLANYNIPCGYQKVSFFKLWTSSMAQGSKLFAMDKKIRAEWERERQTFFSYNFFLLCWGYIVAFMKVLTIYQIYHTWIHPLHHSPLSLLPPFLE